MVMPITTGSFYAGGTVAELKKDRKSQDEIARALRRRLLGGKSGFSISQS